MAAELVGAEVGELLVLDPNTEHDDRSADERRSTALWLLIGAACLVASLIAAVALVAMRGNPSQTGRPASVRTGSATERQLWDLAAKAAREAGTTVKAAHAVRTTASAALWAVMHATSTSVGNGPVWVVQATGRGPFQCGGCGRAIAGKIQAVHGRYMVLMVRPATMGESFGGGFLDQPIDLSSLGTVIDLGG